MIKFKKGVTFEKIFRGDETLSEQKIFNREDLAKAYLWTANSSFSHGFRIGFFNFRIVLRHLLQ